MYNLNLDMAFEVLSTSIVSIFYKNYIQRVIERIEVTKEISGRTLNTHLKQFDIYSLSLGSTDPLPAAGPAPPASARPRFSNSCNNRCCILQFYECEWLR